MQGRWDSRVVSHLVSMAQIKWRREMKLSNSMNVKKLPQCKQAVNSSFQVFFFNIRRGIHFQEATPDTVYLHVVQIDQRIEISFGTGSLLVIPFLFAVLVYVGTC